MTVGIGNYGEARRAWRTNGNIRLPYTDKGIAVASVQNSNLTLLMYLPTGRSEL